MSIKKSVLNLLGLGSEKASTKSGSADQPQSVEAFLGELPEKIGFEVSFSKKETDEGIVYEVNGADAEEFLGNTTEVLDALSHLSMRVQRRVQGVSNSPTSGAAGSAEENTLQRIRFDSEGLRERRKTEIQDMAKQMHEKVKESGRAVYVSAMGPAERKVLHTAIADLGQEVVTESIGRGHYKRIRIKLAGSRPPRGDRADGPGRREGHRDGQRGARRGSGESRRGGGGRFGGRPQGGGARPNDRGFNSPYATDSANAAFDVSDDIGNRATPHEAEVAIDDNFGNRAGANAGTYYRGDQN